MEGHRFATAALIAALGWPLVGAAAGEGPEWQKAEGGATVAQTLEPACLSSEEVSPGTMTPLGFPCPEGTVPANSADADSRVARRAEDASPADRTAEVGPAWIRNPTGVAGVSGSSRMSGEEKAEESAEPPLPPGRVPAEPR